MNTNKQNLIKWLWLVAVAVFCAGLLMQTSQETMEAINYGKIEVKRPANIASMLADPQPQSNRSSQGKTNQTRVHVTAFSTHECKTTFCISQIGKPRQYTAAVNRALFGRPAKVYIAAYDREYAVIGTTDQHTDVDLFFGDDYQGALEFGSKQLLVTFIYD